MSMLFQRCLQRARLAGGLIEDWQLHHKQAMAVRDLEELIQEFLEVGKLNSHMWQTMLESLFEGQIDDIDDAGKLARHVADLGVKLFETLERVIVAANQEGYHVDESDMIAKAAKGARDLQTEVTKKWPTPEVDWDMVRESREAHEKGEYQSAEDLIHALPSEGA